MISLMIDQKHLDTKGQLHDCWDVIHGSCRRFLMPRLFCSGFGLMTRGAWSDHGKWFPCTENTRSACCHECKKPQDSRSWSIDYAESSPCFFVTQKEDCRKPFAMKMPFFLAPKWTRPVLIRAHVYLAKIWRGQVTCVTCSKIGNTERIESDRTWMKFLTSWPSSCSLTMQWWWSANHLLLTATAPGASTRTRELEKKTDLWAVKVPQESKNAEVTYGSHLYQR